MSNTVAAYTNPWCADGGWGIGRADAGAWLDNDLALGQYWPLDDRVGSDANTAGADQAAIDAGLRTELDVSIAFGAAEDARALVNAD